MRHVWIAGCLLLLAACSNKVTDSAVALTVSYPGYAPACVRVTATDAADPSRTSSELLPQDKLAAHDQDRTLVIAVYREKTWSQQLQIQVASFATGDCGGSAVETRALDAAVTLPAKGTVSAKVELLARDADKDGYASRSTDAAIQGTDCDDTKGTVHPGAVAVCGAAGSLDTDFNCDGKVDCNGSRCTGNAQCGSGFCVDGICCENACNTPPQCHGAGFCGTGTCTYAVTATAACDDGDKCTTSDKCDAAGVCKGSAVTCTTAPGQCYGNNGTCNASTGACEYPALPPTTSCNDGNKCTTADKCDGAGACAGTAVTCTTAPGQCYGSNGTCNASTGACDYPKLPSTTSCDDGNKCTTGDKCDGAGACAGTAVTCTTGPGQCYGNNGTCNTGTGVCEYPKLPSTTSCDDGVACTSPDKCDGNGSCASVMNCPPPNACKVAAATCTADGLCQYVVDSTHVGKSCTDSGKTGTCLPDGTCQTFPYTVTANFDPNTIANNTLNDLSIDCDATFDSSGTTPTWTDVGCGFARPTVVVANGVAVVAVRNLTVNAKLRLVGTRPVVFAVYGDGTFNNEVHAESLSSSAVGGAGNGVSCTGRTGSGGTNSGGDGSGGGGGGLGTAGGKGGNNDDNTSTGGNGGVAAAAGFSPLVGGCAGGDGNGPGGTTGGPGGLGGGSLQISVAGTLTLRSVVTVSGAGGRGGATTTNNKSAGGGGGGSGGMLVLEASTLNLDPAARLTANGGAGGEGASDSGTTLNAGGPGADGSAASATAATGGTGGSTEGGDGGSGAAGASFPGDGLKGTGTHGSGGGGGGSAGRILLRGVTACSPSAGSLISPDPSKTGGVCP